MSQEMRYEVYQCLVCKETDTGKFFPTEGSRPIINCWKCGAGRGVISEHGLTDPMPQLQARKGMVNLAGAKALGLSERDLPAVFAGVAAGATGGPAVSH